MQEQKDSSIFQSIENYLPQKPEGEKRLVREAREALLENLEKKTSLIYHLKELTDSVTLEESIEEVGEKLNRYMREAQDQFPQTAEKEMEREKWQKILNESEEKTAPLMNEEALTDEEEHELNKQLEDNGLFREKLRALENDPDLAFLMSVRAVIESLKSKYSFVADHCNTKEGAIKKAGEILKTPLQANSIQKLAIKPFSIEVVLEPEFFKKLSKRNKNSGAFHLSGSPFNIVSKNKNPLITEFSARHEDIHNLFEGISNIPPYPSEKIKKLLPNNIERLRRMQKMGTPESIKKGTEELITQSLPRIFTDDLHEEMAADIDKVEAGVPFTTAAAEVKRMEEYIDSYSEHISDEEIRLLCVKMKENIQKRFKKSSEIMKESLFIAEKTDKSDEVHGLLAMLKPSKFHHIKTYLRAKLDKETFNGLSAFYRVSYGEKLSLPLLEDIHAMRETLNEGERAGLLVNFSRLRDFQGVDTIEQARLFIQKVRELVPYPSLEKFFSRFEQDIKKGFFTSLLKENIKEDFRTLPTLMDKLNEEEKSIFKKSLADYFALGSAYKDISDDQKKLTHKSLSSFPFWEVLKRLGLQQIAQRELRKFERNYPQ